MKAFVESISGRSSSIWLLMTLSNMRNVASSSISVMGDRFGVSSSSISVLLVMTVVSHSTSFIILMGIVLGMLGVGAMIVISVLMPSSVVGVFVIGNVDDTD